MLAIIAHHYVVNSGLDKFINADPTSGRSLFLLLFGAWGKTGINCFLMITGFFMCKSRITLKKYLKLVLEIEFYKIAIFIIFAFTGNTSCTPKLLAKALSPVENISQGFSSCFVVFYLFIPFLNLLIDRMTEKSHRLLLALLLFFYTILPIGYVGVIFNYVTWFSIVYLIAAYVRCYPQHFTASAKVSGCWFFGCIALSSLSVVALAYLAPRHCYYLLSDSNKILAVANAVSGFLFFKNLKIPYSKFINAVASSVFGVLLIHANSDAMRKWLWEKTLRCTDFYDSPYLILHAVLSVLGIYLICTVIDQLRIRFLERPFFRRFGAKLDELQERFAKKYADPPAKN